MYEARLKQCKLTTLEAKRVKGDQIEVFIVIHLFTAIDNINLFMLGRQTSLEDIKIDKEQSKAVLNVWSRLLIDCVNVTNVNTHHLCLGVSIPDCQQAIGFLSLNSS